MRRALVLAGVLFAALLAAVPALAAGAEREVERELAFGLKAEGFDVAVFVSNNDGNVSATMIVGRGPRIAYYSTPAEVTAERVTAQFGGMGELDYRFAPKRNGRVECTGSENGEPCSKEPSTSLARTAMSTSKPTTPKGPSRSTPSRRTARRNDSPGAPGGITRTTRTKGRLCTRGPFHEPKERCAKSSSSTKAGTGTRSFSLPPWSKGGTWRGSLGMPILGGEPVELAGHEFRAFIHKGVPQDE